MFALKLLFLVLLTACFSISSSKIDLEDYIRERAQPFSSTEDMNDLIAQAGSRKLVLLGEASHGTHEYYTWRDSISRRLISDYGFNFIAVEGDFASLYELNRYVKNLSGAAASAVEVLEKFNRWPAWMWGNEEIVRMSEWLRTYNDGLPQEQKVGFYGMDVYDEWNSQDALLGFLKENNADIYDDVKEYYACFAPYAGDSWLYARSLQTGQTGCADQTKRVIELLERERELFEDISDYDFFYAMQNARVFHNAEKFYRKSVLYQDGSAWNARVDHMHETVKNLLSIYGENSRGIVWAHNTHIGDARYTDMNKMSRHNIGQLSRIHHNEENVFLIGFTTYKGRVMAGAQWGSPMKEMHIPKAIQGSFEKIFFKTEMDFCYLIFDENDRKHSEFIMPRGHRAVGVVYSPVNDHRQFVSTVLPMRYDAFIFFSETKALKPLR